MRLVDCIVDCFIDYTVDNVKNIHKFIKPAFDLVRVHTQMHVFSTVGFIALMFTLRRRKHTSLLVTVYKYKFTQDHDAVVHLVVHTPQGFVSVKHVSVLLTCGTDGARSTMGNMLRQVIAPLHQERCHQDPFLRVRFCLCCIACALTSISLMITCTFMK